MVWAVAVVAKRATIDHTSIINRVDFIVVHFVVILIRYPKPQKVKFCRSALLFFRRIHLFVDEFAEALFVGDIPLVDAGVEGEKGEPIEISLGLEKGKKYAAKAYVINEKNQPIEIEASLCECGKLSLSCPMYSIVFVELEEI